MLTSYGLDAILIIDILVSLRTAIVTPYGTVALQSLYCTNKGDVRSLNYIDI